MLRALILGVPALLLAASVATAGTVNLSNGTQSAKATWSTTSTSATLEAWNTTATTKDAGDLLTGIRFTVTGASAFSLSTDLGDLIYVKSDGSIDDSDGSGLKDLTWGLVSGSGYYELRFNQPNATHGILGPAESDGTYSQANSSIKGNSGHNPFTREYAKFTFSLTEATGATAGIQKVTFLFGTDLGTHVVPLPPAAWTGLGLLAGLIAFAAIRRRRAAF